MTRAIASVARDEGIEPEHLAQLVAEGRAVITGKAREHCKVIGIGEGLKTKINANIGTSPDHKDIDVELRKLEVAIENGADAVMDLSTGGDINDTRKRILEKSTVPVGTVPIYQAVVEVTKKGGNVEDCTVDDFFDVVRNQAMDGVDFMTIHAGLTRELSRRVVAKRVAGVVSRGGSFLLQWMAKNKSENPYYQYFNRLLDLAEEFDFVISLGDGLRPGAIADASDSAQIGELVVIGELVERARKRGVGVIVEGPGHVPLHEIPSNMIMEKAICKGAPFYVLGPLVTDVAPGSPADKAGLRGGTKWVILSDGSRLKIGGDVIIGVDGMKIFGLGDLLSYLEEYKRPGDEITLTIYREGKQLDVKLVLGAIP